MFIVLTKTGYTAKSKDRILEIARGSVPILKKQPGLVSHTQHLSHDDTHMMTYWVWQDEASHLACMSSDDWAPYNAQWAAMIESGEMTFYLKTYDLWKP